MIKFSKKITLILIAVLCLALFAGVLVACNTDNGVNYTVTVLLPDGETAANGINVSVMKGAATLATKATGDDGKAVFKLAEDDYTVEISSKYFVVANEVDEDEEDAELTFSEERALTVKLEDTSNYRVKLINLDGTPFYVKDVQVSVCTILENGATGNCFEGFLFQDGIARSYAELGNYKVKLELPDEYELYNGVDEHGYYVAQTLSEELTEIVIVVVHKIDVTPNTITVEEELIEYPNQSGTLVGVPMDGTAELVYNETDKFYHLGKADGPVVVVKITAENDLDRFKVGGALAYFELLKNGPSSDIYKFDVTPADAPEYTKVVDDYRIFIRGFEDYVQTPNMGKQMLTIPNEITTEVYYAKSKFVNDDGVYPLNEELKTFLKGFYKHNKSFVDTNTNDAEEGWLFPCYYYAEGVVQDVVVGEYKVQMFTDSNTGDVYNIGDDLDGSPMTADSFKLTVSATSYKIEQLDVREATYGEFETGTYTKNDDGTYKFVLDFWGDEFVVTYNTADQTITFVLNDETMYIFKKA